MNFRLRRVIGCLILFLATCTQNVAKLWGEDLEKLLQLQDHYKQQAQLLSFEMLQTAQETILATGNLVSTTSYFDCVITRYGFLSTRKYSNNSKNLDLSKWENNQGPFTFDHEYETKSILNNRYYAEIRLVNQGAPHWELASVTENSGAKDPLDVLIASPILLPIQAITINKSIKDLVANKENNVEFDANSDFVNLKITLNRNSRDLPQGCEKAEFFGKFNPSTGCCIEQTVVANLDATTKPLLKKEKLETVVQFSYLPFGETDFPVSIIEKSPFRDKKTFFKNFSTNVELNVKDISLENYGLPEPKFEKGQNKAFMGMCALGAFVFALVLALVYRRNVLHSNNKRGAFALIELLGVITIISILIGLALPAVQMVREAGRRTQCLSNLEQIGTALQNYESTRQKLPAGITAFGAEPYSSTTWLVKILPFVEQQNMWDQSISDYRADPSPFLSHLGMRTVVNLYQCPSDPESGKVQWTHENRLVATSSYIGVNGTDYKKRDGIFYLNSATSFRDILDGMSNTLIVGERPPSPDYWYGWWYAGYGQSGSGSPDMLLGLREVNDPPPAGETKYLESCPPGPYRFTKGKYGEQSDTLHFWSYHSGGANFAFCDGSVRFIPYSGDSVMPQLATRAGNEVFQSPFE